MSIWKKGSGTLIIVKQNSSTKELEVSFKYLDEYVKRIREIPGARWNPDSNAWIISDLMVDSLDRIFKGELIYMTPKWEITGETPPDYTKLYSHITNKPIDLKPPYKPYPFQAFGSNFLVEQAKTFGFACLLDDMGTGKTIQSIGASLILENDVNLHSHNLPILIVCKSSLKYQWVTDGIEKFTYSTSVVIDGTKAKRAKLYSSIKNSKVDYVITSYELVLKDIDILSKIDIGLIIFDEAHKIRNHSTQTNKACTKLKAQYKFFLTGSPISGKPDEIFGIGKIGNKKYFGDFKNFSKEYLRYRRTSYGMELFGYQNLDKLKESINNISLRRTEKEVGLQMPTIIQQNIYVEMSPEQKAIDTMLQEESSKLQDKIHQAQQIQDQQKRTEKLEQLKGSTKGLLALRLGAADSPELFLLSKSPAIQKKYGSMVTLKKSCKLDYLKEHVQEIVDAGHKVVIFTKFETMTRIIARELSKITDVVTFTGQMNAIEKEKARIKFKTTNSCGCFIATNSGAEGINLQESKYLINYELDWDIGINDQRNKRIRRLDSTFDKVFIYNYIAKGSADELVVLANERKQNIFDYLIENTSAQSKQMVEFMQKF